MFDMRPDEGFTDQPDDDAVLWRYMDLARFLSLIEDEALYFARADQMQDKWEGAYSQLNVERALANKKPFATNLPALRPFLVRHTHISCWHESDYESAAMWDIYQREGRGVSVQTTWGDLKVSLLTGRRIWGGRVQYVDYKDTVIPDDKALASFMHKRLSFSHEREVRLLMLTGENRPLTLEERQAEVVETPVEPPVLPIRVNLRALIRSVYVAPDAPDWIAALIGKVIKRYGYDFELLHSDLATDPVS